MGHLVKTAENLTEYRRPHSARHAAIKNLNLRTQNPAPCPAGGIVKPFPAIYKLNNIIETGFGEFFFEVFGRDFKHLIGILKADALKYLLFDIHGPYEQNIENY